MDPIMTTCIIVLIIVIILIWAIATYNNFKKLEIKIELSKNNMNSLIRDEYDTLNNISNIISEIDKKESPFKNLNELKNNKSSNFEIDRKLKEYMAEYYKYKERYNKEFEENENIKKLDDKINELNEYIKGTQNYYNDTVIKYNKKIKMFPNIIISTLTSQKKKPLYEESNNDFKL